jgi:hypothetical protein
MSTSTLPAALSLLALGAAGAALGLRPAQTSPIEGRNRPATVWFRGEALGVQAATGLQALDDSGRYSVAGKLISIDDTAVQLEIDSNRLWIPRETVLAVYFDA